MRIGLAYNEKPAQLRAASEPPSTNDEYVEWDEPSTIEAVAHALAPLGDVIRLEADAFFPQKLALARPDILFNMAEGLHGPSREAQVPAICEYMDVPYTGSDPLTLGLALHKGRAKEVMAFRGVATAPFAVIETAADLDRVKLPFPLFVKPVAEGSSKGIFVNNLCDTPEQLRDRVFFLLEEYHQAVLVETYLPGPEFTVAILGNGATAHCLPVVAIDFSALPPGSPPVYGYEAKWLWDTLDRPLSIFECPASVPEDLYQRIEQAALEGYRALGCRDWCRVDVRLDEFRIPNIVELNPLPGIIPDPRMNSCFPKAARAAGMSYDDLIRSVVHIACERLGSPIIAAPVPRAAIA